MSQTTPQEVAIFQAKNGAIEIKLDTNQETFWATRMQMAEIFGVNPQAISKHLGNIYRDKELDKKTTSSKMELVQSEAGRQVTRKVDFYNLDAVISVGYRINSRNATHFRIWATKTLKNHISKGYTVNKKRLEQNYQEFLQTVEDIKCVSKNNQIANNDILELIKTFSSTWFNLENYDKQNFPNTGDIKKDMVISVKELNQEVEKLKKELIKKQEATELFAKEIQKGSLQGILGNVMQSVFKKDAYSTVEEKATHLLYFIVKNHPFIDGNKRVGAFAFIWFLQKTGYYFINKITPETLTAIALLVARSDPKEQDRMIGLILLLLKN